MMDFDFTYVTTELTELPGFDIPVVIRHACIEKGSFIEDKVFDLEQHGYKVQFQVIPFEINVDSKTCQLLIVFNYRR